MLDKNKLEAVVRILEQTSLIDPNYSKDVLISFVRGLGDTRNIPHEELYKASKVYCPDDAYPFAPTVLTTTVREAFIEGARWMEKQ